jgi:hypothetical protein
MGATPVVADALDAEAVGVAISEFGPDAIVSPRSRRRRRIWSRW